MKWILATIFFASSLCFAQRIPPDPPPPYNLKFIKVQNCQFSVKIPKYVEAGMKESGTNCNFEIQAYMGLADYVPGDPTPSDPFTWATLDKLQVKIEAATDPLDHTWDPSPDFVTMPASGSGIYSKSVRFASTHFNDGATITIKVKATFKAG